MVRSQSHVTDVRGCNNGFDVKMCGDDVCSAGSLVPVSSFSEPTSEEVDWVKSCQAVHTPVPCSMTSVCIPSAHS